MDNDAIEKRQEKGDSGDRRPYAEKPEAAFSVTGIRALQLAADDCRPGVPEFLARQVARNPEDLRCHVQRLSFFLTKRDSLGAYGAILDLFLALGEKGVALRRRMLRTATPFLLPDHRRALDEKLACGLSPLDPMPVSSESILGKNVQGTTRLIERDAAVDRSGPDPLDEARSRLEYGQVDEARDVLERTILEDPLREDVQNELLEIYVRSKDHAQFSSMLQALRFTGNPIPGAWQRLAAELGLEED